MITKAFIWLSVLAMHACAAVVTLYGVSFTGPMPSDLPSVSFQEDFTVSYRAISPSQGSDVTTYEVQEVITQEILVKNYGTATSTYTAISTPTTIKYTRVEGKSLVHQTVSGAISTPKLLPDGSYFAVADSTLDCQFDVDKQQGICAQEVAIPNVNIQNTKLEMDTVYRTFTGPLVPIATVTTSGAAVLASMNWLSVGWGVLLLTSSLLLLR